jgi:IscR-regulated protein YhgI
MSTRLSKLLKPIQSLLGSGPHTAPARASALNVAGEAQAAEPVQVNHAWSPEPNAIKLQINRMLLPLGEKRVYANAGETAYAPLGQTLFGVDGIEQVTIESAFVTVLMAEDADWDGLMEQVPVLIKKHLGAGLPAVIEAPKKKYAFKFKQVESRTPEQQFEIVQKLIDDEINPAVAAHGGQFQLMDVRDNRVFVKVGGGCQGCGMVDATLRQGVEKRLKEVLPELVALIDVTDHKSGENPYYPQDAHAGHQH